jgi:hypothetical protein
VLHWSWIYWKTRQTDFKRMQIKWSGRPMSPSWYLERLLKVSRKAVLDLIHVFSLCKYYTRTWGNPAWSLTRSACSMMNWLWSSNGTWFGIEDPWGITSEQLLRTTLKNKCRSQMPVAHACNPSYSGGRDQEDRGSKPAQANSSSRPYLENPFTKMGLLQWLKVKALSSSPSPAKKEKKKKCLGLGP